MALTGEPNGEPMKVGVPIGDLMAGMFASVGILAAVRHQITTGKGQFIDIGMLDTHVAWLANQGMNYLSTSKIQTDLETSIQILFPIRLCQPLMDILFFQLGMTQHSRDFVSWLEKNNKMI